MGTSKNGNCTYWDGTFEDLKTNVSPFSNGLKINAAVNQGLGKVSSPGAKGICADRNRTGYFVGLKEFNCLEERRNISHEFGHGDSIFTSSTGKSWNSFSAKNSL